MFQPWASLLIHGFKRFEGRVWDTNYRGPLWIHAGAKEPTKNEIELVENQYRKMYEGYDMPEFPKSYPTGCILGVIDLQCIVDQTLYQKHIPKQFTVETTREFLFVIRNPRRLIVNIKRSGKRGIFELEERLVSTAINTLKKVPTSWFPYFADNLPMPVMQEEELVPDDNKKTVKKPVEKEHTLESLRPKIYAPLNKYSNAMSLTITNEDNPIFDFVENFEESYSHVLELGVNGLTELKIDNSLNGYPHLLGFLESFLVEHYDIQKEMAKAMMPKNLDVYALGKQVKSFEFERSYTMMIAFGRKIDLGFEGQPKAQLQNGSILVSLGSLSKITDPRFVKVVKKGPPGGVRIGETLLF